ncbi:hypothetical protein CAC42_6776 [Sphaceloma murrayae]|uniref:Uncharacterized protein n=1 Tax=Sphaceloma murrayae TaxID=2082308 RepID=A0A2K1QHD1_9PEZI|nr:hypothetical protein CAC42_6776 [Sphaceloma murrayae]
MCGNSSRTTVGGTIAILKSDTGAAPDLNLLFNSRDAATVASIQGVYSTHPEHYHSFDVSIHRDGDLRATSDIQNILHNFSLPTFSDQAEHSSIRLPVSLNLGVGGDGIVGRRIQVRHRGPNGESIVRQGIIGWN